MFKAKAVIPIIGVVLILFGPNIFKEKSQSIIDVVNNSNSSSTTVNKEFAVKVNDISKSNSGFVTCKFYVKQVEKVFIGPCVTTGDKELIVGRTYSVTKAVIDDDFITINDALLIDGMIRKRVVRLFNKGWTRMAQFEDGSIAAVDNTIRVDDYITNE